MQTQNSASRLCWGSARQCLGSAEDFVKIEGDVVCGRQRNVPILHELAAYAAHVCTFRMLRHRMHTLETP
jgi:hypothetical protein